MITLYINNIVQSLLKPVYVSCI